MRPLAVLLAIGFVLSACPVFPQTPTERHRQLQAAVAEENWQAALTLVDRWLADPSLQADPQQKKQLQAYRSRLLTLLPTPTPTISRLTVTRVQAEVAATRSERRIRTLNPRQDNLPITILPDGTTAVVTEVPYAVFFPDRYRVQVIFRGGLGSPPPTETVKVSLEGTSGQASLTRLVTAGGAVAIQPEIFVFSARQVPDPQHVSVQIGQGSPQRFSVSLPKSTRPLPQAIQEDD
ncbi:MAG: hypothetical protein NW237_14760 [Cyanobacteriota bacterium]|nr:hypothetical protein [Cyanobacteriota bacterium]